MDLVRKGDLKGVCVDVVMQELDTLASKAIR